MDRAQHQPSGLDAAGLAIIANRMNAILREMTNTLLRSGRSSILTTARDFSCCIVTADNRLLAAAEGLPVHIFGAHLQTETMAALHADIRPGDAFLHNDPYSGNTHAADHTILVPVFIDGKHLFTAVAKAHQADIGNSFPSTYMPHARDVYEEGALIFSATRVQQAGRDIDDIIRICRMRIRVPDQWYGDYLAALGAARIGERRLIEMVKKYGVETIEAFVEEWFNYSERRMSHALRALTPGHYEAVSYHDPLPGIIDTAIPVNVAVNVSDQGRITVDLRNNMDCIAAGINMSKATSTNSALTGIFNILDSDIPHNHGTTRCIEVLLRENCIVGYPIHPTSCSLATSNLADRVINATQYALSTAGRFGLAEGAASLVGGTAVISGKDVRRGGAAYINQLVVSPGGGAASSACDGWLTMGLPVTGGLVLRDSIEIDEQRYPIIFDRLEVQPDTGGCGRQRGGAGTILEYGPRFDSVTVAIMADGRENPARGAQGGGSGAPHYVAIKDLGTGEETPISSFGQFEMSKFQRLVSIESGGGGFGNPLERDVADVVSDVVSGFVSIEGAARDYGVVLAKAETGAVTIDMAGTRSLRHPS